MVRRCGVEGHGITLRQQQLFESDDGFELTFQDVKVFAAVVPEGSPILGGLPAGFVDDLDEIDLAVIGRREALPPDAGRKVDAAAIARPLQDAGAGGPAGKTPPAVLRRVRRGRRLDVFRSEQEIQIDGGLAAVEPLPATQNARRAEV